MKKEYNQVPEAEHQLAEHQIQMAVAAITVRHRLLGNILAGVRLQVTTIDQGAVTGLHDGRIALVVNSSWAVTAPLMAIEGVLIHEANHLLLGHHEIDGNGLDSKTLEIAKDIAANEYNDRPAPKGTATLADFPRLPPGESVLVRYERLLALHAKAGYGPVNPQESQAGVDQRSSEDAVNNTETFGEEPTDETGKNATDSTSGETQNSHVNDPEKVPPPNDSDVDLTHAGPSGIQSISKLRNKDSTSEAAADVQSMKASLAQNALTVRSIITKAARQVPPESLSPVERDMIVHISDSGYLCGMGTAGEISLLPLSLRREALVPWKRELRHFIGSALPIPQPSYTRPPRRFPSLLGIVPGRQSRPGKPVILAAVDTSGSMSDAQLSDIVVELRVMARGRYVIVAQFDDKVHSVKRFTGRIVRCIGRGGTDFHPIFEAALLRRTKAELVIVFSDGQGPAPQKKPHIPVIWALTTPRQPPATWGAVIRILSD